MICVGRIKTPFWKEAAAHYAGRIARRRPLELTEVRDGDAALPVGKRNAVEGKRLLESLQPQDVPIVLDERGATLTSPQLARWLRELDDSGRGRPCFLVGGAWGLDEEVRRRAWKCLSLSAMTFPHELARVMLLEQLYRADCILCNVPYHH